MTAHVTVEPDNFNFVSFDAGEISDIVVELAKQLGISNPIRLEVDETTPLGKTSARFDGDSTTSDTTIVLRAESGALEDSRHLTNFGAAHARLSLGRILLRARDRMRADFADAPADEKLSNSQNAAWDVYCAGRLHGLGLGPIEQRYRYDFRNRFGFSDSVDTTFDALWAADDLGWADLPVAADS